VNTGIEDGGLCQLGLDRDGCLTQGRAITRNLRPPSAPG